MPLNLTVEYLFQELGVVIVLFLAIVLDALLGEAKRFHPLVAFGCCANALERILNSSNGSNIFAGSILSGVIAWVVLVCPPTLCIYLLEPDNAYMNILFSAVVLYFCIGHRSLKEHNQAIFLALKHNDIDSARKNVSKIVSRDCTNLSELGVRKAALESVLENGADALMAPIFWSILLGPAGAVMYRLANTLDAMWGYKNIRFIRFGRFSARIDDVLNFIPARLTALSYCVLGDTRCGLKAWSAQAHLCSSPNAGPVMAAGAGTLKIRLGGEASYEGLPINKPTLGAGKPPVTEDLNRAINLVSRCLWLWLAVIAFFVLLLEVSLSEVTRNALA